MTTRRLTVALMAAAAASTASAAVPTLAFAPPSSRRITSVGAAVDSTQLNMCPGGWGIPGSGGNISEEEYADNRGRASSTGRRGYDAYELENRGQFMKRVRDERTSLKQKKKNELLEIARMAGIKTKEKYEFGRFDDDLIEDDDIDVRVDWDADDKGKK